MSQRNISKKRTHTDFRENLHEPYDTDKESRRTAKTRKINDGSSVQKPHTNPKQAGRNLRSGGTYGDLIEKPISRGYQTETQSRKAKPTSRGR